MSGNVLIAYGTKNGSTARIAEAIAEVLREQGLDATAVDAKAADRLAAYDAVVLGGSLYAGRWHKDTRRFVRRHQRELAERPLWLFSSGPLDRSAAECDIPPVPGAQRTMDRCDAEEHVTFRGRLEEDAKGFIARNIVSSGKGGDFRDFTQIKAWARKIATELKEQQQTN